MQLDNRLPRKLQIYTQKLRWPRTIQRTDTLYISHTEVKGQGHEVTCDTLFTIWVTNILVFIHSFFKLRENIS